MIFDAWLDTKLRKNYLYSYQYSQFYGALTSLFTTYKEETGREDLAGFRKQMREAGYFIPHMDMDYDNTPVVRKFAFKYYIDGKFGFHKLSPNEATRDWGLFRNSTLSGYPSLMTPSEEATHAYNQTALDYDGNVYNLYDWIHYGRICECGNHFVSISQEECPACQELNRPLPYSSRAEDILGHEETKDIKFGIELEYEGVFRKHVEQHLKEHAIAKSDGTISNGVEVVTRPASLATHKKTLKNFFDNVRVRAANNTGMHIHVEKAKLSEYQVGFILWFMNNPDNTTFITKVAQREYCNNTYCRPDYSVGMTSFLRPGNNKWYSLVRGSSGKYRPFNTDKTFTYEFRVFRSPESHLEMSAKLDFVKALIDYSSPYSVNCKSLKEKVQSENFLNYIKSNRKEYPDFYQYFVKEERI